MEKIVAVLQLVAGLGILNVWIVRSSRPTRFRGGEAKNLREEFAAYGLPFWFFCVVGVLKVGLALALIAAVWVHSIAQPAAIALGLLMVGALVMHFKVKDSLQKAMPATGMLVLCAAIALMSPGTLGN